MKRGLYHSPCMATPALYIYMYARKLAILMILLLASLSIQGRNNADSLIVVEADTLVSDKITDVIADSLAAEITDTIANDSLPWPQSLQCHLTTIIEKSDFLNQSQLGMMVYDLTSDSVLFTHNHRQTMRPASTMKLITAITALDKLGGSYQFKTRLRYNGEIIDSIRTLNGDVYLVGGMDPRFNRDDILAFVESLKSLGIDSIHGNIYADKSMKDRDLLGEGWCWDDDNPVLTPTLYSRKDRLLDQFLTELEKAGIVFDGVIGEKTAPPSCKLACTRSHSIDQILVKMMKDSDNLYAESMFYQTAATYSLPAKASGARKVTQNLMRKMHLNPANYRIADGSGLSLYNYLSAELEIAFLRYAYVNSTIFNHIYSALPVAGVDGTLEKRMKGTSAARNVHAKTGTLSGISSLAGYVKAANGHMLAFCIINQGVLRAAHAKAFQNKVCVAMSK